MLDDREGATGISMAFCWILVLVLALVVVPAATRPPSLHAHDKYSDPKQPKHLDLEECPKRIGDPWRQNLLGSHTTG